MEASLESLGFDGWFEKRLDRRKAAVFAPVRVVAIDKGSCVVRGAGGETRGELAGKLLYASDSPLDLPVVGDWAYAQIDDGDSPAVLHELLPRKSVLKRKTSGRKTEHQLIAANIDTAFAVQALDADFNPRRLERYLAMIVDGGIRPAVLLTKSDLLPEQEVERRVREIRKVASAALVEAFSNESEEDVERIGKAFLPGCTYCLLGSSGVGKTTLINNLLGGERFRIDEVRRKDGKGRHTTTRRHLVVAENGAMIVDTPGMRELANIGGRAGIEDVFAEIAELESMCRFSDCSHVREAGCAVLRALDEGRIREERLRSYMKLGKESAFHGRTYLERRREDRRFGKMCRRIVKNSVKR